MIHPELKEFDVWSNHHGKITCRLALKDFVDDTDAPYTFHKHELRIAAASKKDAIAAYRAQRDA